MKRPAPVSVGSHLACVVGRPTLVGACNQAVDGATGRGEPTVRSSMASAGGVRMGIGGCRNTIRGGGVRAGGVRSRWGRGSKWTAVHRQWIAQQVLAEPALNRVVGTYQGGLAAGEAELAAVETGLATWGAVPPLAATVTRLGAYRGIAALTGMTLAAEVVDWRRFAAARPVMGFCGVIPPGYSRGGATPPGPV